MRIAAARLASSAIVGCAALLLGAAPTAAEDDPATLRGVARGADGPAVGADVAAGIVGWAPAAADHVAIVPTDAEGKFAMPRAPLGPIDVWVRPKGGTWTFAFRMSHPSLNDLEIDARAKRGLGSRGAGGFGDDGKGTVAGVVTDKAGKPIAGAAAGLRGDDSTWVLTDAKGQFTLEKAADDDGLVVRANGYRDSVGKVSVDKKTGRGRVAIKLDVSKTSVVHVNDPSGKPLAGAWVTLGDPERVFETTGFSALFPPRPRLTGAWTDEKGDARVPWGDPEDATVATAYAAGFAPASKKFTAGKPVLLQVAACRPVRATVVLRGTSEPVAGVYVGLPHASDGGPDAISALPEEAERGPVIVGRTDAKGECRVAHLPAGVDTLRVVGDMKVRSEVRIQAAEGGGDR